MAEAKPETANTPEIPQKKAYHTPDLRDFGTVKELTLTGSTPGGPDYQGGQEYFTGAGGYG